MSFRAVAEVISVNLKNLYGFISVGTDKVCRNGYTNLNMENSKNDQSIKNGKIDQGMEDIVCRYHCKIKYGF